MAKRKHPAIKGGYIIVPNTTIQCKQYKRLSVYAKVVFQTMLTKFIRDNRLNPDNLVQISHSEIEYVSGVTHGSVVRAMRELKDKGFMRTETPGGLLCGESRFQLNGRYLDTGSLNAMW